MVSRKESRAFKTEIGRLSVVPGLSMRVRPLILSPLGRILVARMRGMRRASALIQSGCMRASTLSVKPL